MESPLPPVPSGINRLPLPPGGAPRGGRLSALLILVTVALVIIPHETSRSHRQESISFLRQRLGTRTATLEHTIWYDYAPPDDLARYDIVVGWSWFNVSELRALNPNGIFLLNPALTAAEVPTPSMSQFPKVRRAGRARRTISQEGSTSTLSAPSTPCGICSTPTARTRRCRTTHASRAGTLPIPTQREDPRARLQDLRLRR